MSIKTHLSTKKMAAGAALVALSGFVPQPFMQQAEAATTTITVTGSFITGVQLAAGTSVKFGVLAATAGNGKATLSTTGAVTPSNAVKVGAVSQAGTISLKVVSTTIGMDVTVGTAQPLGAVVLAASAGGGGPTGAVSINKLIMGGAFTAPFTVTDAGGGTGKTTGIKGSAATGIINVGGQIVWGATQPIGAFSELVSVRMAF